MTAAALTPQHRQQLHAAVEQLEEFSFAARLADYCGQPINAVLKYLPGVVNRQLRDAVQTAIFKCLTIALESIGKPRHPLSSEWGSKLVSGVTGGIGGFFGMVALPIELPVTTTLLMRSIAEIARDEGEDLGRIETQLACLEVFALGGRETDEKVDMGYYATRTVLAKLTGDMAAYMLERGALNATTPIVARLVGEIVSRYGFVVSERAAAGALPVIGAVGGASVNMIFMDHFQRVARGHFTVRRLERRYGADQIQVLYHHHKQELAAQRRKRPLLMQLVN